MDFSVVELVILGLSTILQLICLVAPGWRIEIYEGYEGSAQYLAIFYILKCVKSDCKVMSWRGFNKDLLSPEHYSKIVRQQIFLIFALLATAVCLVLHIAKHRRQMATSLLVAMTTCSCMIGSGALMITIGSIQDPEKSHIGFPYYVIHMMAFIGNITVFILCVVDVVREQRRQTSQDIFMSETG